MIARGSALCLVVVVLDVVVSGAGASSLRAQDPAPPVPPEPRWLVGDLHVHVSPPDEAGHSLLTVAKAIAAARTARLDFVVLTPHDADKSFPGEKDAPPRYGQELVEEEAARAAPGAPLVVVAGWEWTRERPGHLGVSFARIADIASFRGERKAEEAIRRGGLVVVNHPFFRPVRSDLPVMKLVQGDRSWRPFLGDVEDPGAWNAIEVWHERSVLVEKMHANVADDFPGTQMARDAIRAWDRSTREQRRRIVAVGGSDAHGKLPYAIVPMRLVAVRAETANAEGLRRGLLAGAVTFGKDGGLAASDLAATSDIAGQRAIVGGSVRARAEVRLAWEGRAVLFEDGERVGEFDGGTTRAVAPAGSFHAWRIEKPGDAFSNMVYANLR